jgi:hypothetical protein
MILQMLVAEEHGFHSSSGVEEIVRNAAKGWFQMFFPECLDWRSFRTGITYVNN